MYNKYIIVKFSFTIYYNSKKKTRTETFARSINIDRPKFDIVTQFDYITLEFHHFISIISIHKEIALIGNTNTIWVKTITDNVALEPTVLIQDVDALVIPVEC